MTRRSLIPILLLGAGAVATMRWNRPGHRVLESQIDPEDWDHRVRFLCCDDYEDARTYSPAVYLRVGGGRGAFTTVREAAPFLRPEDPYSSAAGLCGYLFNQIHYDQDTGGTMSVSSPPEPGKDGKVDWDAYGGDSDIILINVRSNSAKCCFGRMIGEEIHDLPIGKSKARKR